MKVDRPVSPRERILAAADKLFYGQGVRAVGVDAVAAEADVSKRTLYAHFPSKDELIAAYLTARFRNMVPSDAPAREQILGYYDYLERAFSRPDFRGCPYVNAVTELGDPKHAAAGIALQYKRERKGWFKALLQRIGVRDADVLAGQLQLLGEGALSAWLVQGDPSVARSARAAAEVLIDANSSTDTRFGKSTTPRRDRRRESSP